ncbi:hypothetical protein ACI8AC_03650 [Geodermatophilus sp. SYSU D00758]
MTDRARTAVGARVLALGASAAATLALMGGMAAAAPDTGTAPTSPGTATPVDPQQASPRPQPQPQPTTAPPTTSSHAS